MKKPHLMVAALALAGSAFGVERKLTPEIGWDEDYLFSVRIPAGAKVLKLLVTGVQNGNHCAWGGAGFVRSK